MKKTILNTLFLFLTLGVMAQETTEEKKNYRHAIGISAGTGLGVDYSFKLNDHFYLSASYHLFDYTYEDFAYEVDGENLLLDAQFDYQGIDLRLSIHPFKNGFRLVGGYGKFDRSDLLLTGSFENSVNIGDVEFTTDDIGILTIGLTWKQNLPYAGIGFGRPVPKNKRLGFGMEIGTYFAGPGTVNLQATGIIEDTATQQQLLQDSLGDELTYLPYLTFRLAYSIF